MDSLQLEMDDHFSKMERYPTYTRLTLKTALLALVMFILGVITTLVFVHTLRGPNNSGNLPSLHTDHLSGGSPTCDKGKKLKPEDAVVYSPLLALSAYEADMIEIHLNLTFNRSHTIILDCPSDNKSSTGHPAVTLVRHLAQILKASNGTRKISLPHFWLRTLPSAPETNRSDHCTELIHYAIQNTPALFDGVLIDAEQLKAFVNSTNKGEFFLRTWNNVTEQIIDHWDKLGVNVGVIFSSKSCLSAVYDSNGKFRNGLHKAFYFDYERELVYSEQAAYVRVSQNYKSCRNNVAGQLPFQYVLTDEYDTLNAVQHPRTSVLCLTNG